MFRVCFKGDIRQSFLVLHVVTFLFAFLYIMIRRASLHAWLHGRSSLSIVTCHQHKCVSLCAVDVEPFLIRLNDPIKLQSLHRLFLVCNESMFKKSNGKFNSELTFY